MVTIIFKSKQTLDSMSPLVINLLSLAQNTNYYLPSNPQQLWNCSEWVMNRQIQWAMFSPHLPWVLILFNTSLLEIPAFLGFRNTLHTLSSNTLPLKIMLLFTSISSSAFFVPQICFYIFPMHFEPYIL